MLGHVYVYISVSVLSRLSLFVGLDGNWLWNSISCLYLWRRACLHIALMSASCWQRHQTSKSASEQTNKQQRERVLGQPSINIQVFQTASTPQPCFFSPPYRAKCINLSGKCQSVCSYPSIQYSNLLLISTAFFMPIIFGFRITTL